MILQVRMKPCNFKMWMEKLWRTVVPWQLQHLEKFIKEKPCSSASWLKLLLRLQLAIPITGALLNSPRVLEAHETIVPWQLWHYIYIYIFLNAKNVKKIHFLKEKFWIIFLKKLYFGMESWKWIWLFNKHVPKPPRYDITTIFEQNRIQNTCNNALLGKTPCIILKKM